MLAGLLRKITSRLGSIGRRSGQAVTVTQRDFGGRLRGARVAKDLSPERACDLMGLSVDAIVAMEAGEAPVSSRELERFCEVYGAEPIDFFRQDGAPQAVVRAIYRSATSVRERDEVTESLGDSIRVHRQLAKLKTICGVEPVVPAAYDRPPPRNAADAIAQGVEVARLERGRLCLGDGPIDDVWGLIEGQGVDVGLRALKGDVSGVMLAQDGLSPFIIVNREEHVLRRTFSLAHEYAHVVLDRGEVGIVSRTSQGGSLREVRANAFASEFLLPERGVAAHLASIGKYRPAFMGSWRGEIEPQDVAGLVERYRIGRMVVLHKLRKMRFLDAASHDALRERTEHLPEPAGLDHKSARERFRMRYAALAERSFRSGHMSSSKLVEVLAMEFGLAQASAMVRGPGGIRPEMEFEER